MAELGSGSGTGYPAALDTDSVLEIDSPSASKTQYRADVPNDTNAAILAIQTELGTDPSGTKASVKEFLQEEHSTNGTHKSWRQVYSNTLASAATSVTISGLDGNTDISYWIVARIIGGTTADIYLQPNGDTASNYGSQRLVGNNTTVSALRNTSETGLKFDSVLANNVTMIKGILYAKSGYGRTFNGETMNQVTGTTINGVVRWDSVWNNTADNITSLVLLSSAASGLGIGTFIEIYALGY